MKSKCHKCGVEMSVPEEVLRKYSKKEITYKRVSKIYEFIGKLENQTRGDFASSDKRTRPDWLASKEDLGY